MKTILLTATYLIGIGELILAIYFWVTHSKSEVRKVMAFLSFALSGWVFSNAGVGLSFLTESIFAYGLGPIVLTALLHLALIYPFPIVRVDRWHIFLMYFPAAIFTYATLFTNTIVSSVYQTSKRAAVTVGGELFIIYNTFLFLLWLCGLGILLVKAKRIDGFQRKNILIIFWAFLLAGLPAMFFSVAHLMQEIPFNSLFGPIASGIWLGAVAYIILRK